jgi:hypothetical protein
VLAALADGSLHTIPLHDGANERDLSSEHLTQALRLLFEQHGGNLSVKGTTPSKKEGPRSTGFCVLEPAGEIAWTYEYAVRDFEVPVSRDDLPASRCP